MKNDWFLKGLLLTKEECDQYKREDWRNVDLNEEEYRYKLCQWWARCFFEKSNGLKKFAIYLRQILVGEENADSQGYPEQRKFFQQMGIQDENINLWFFSHCWMIKGGDNEEVERGSTSRMPRNLLYCQKEESIDPSDDHYTDEYFIRLLENEELRGQLSYALGHLNEYPVLQQAINRFKQSNKRVSGSVGWYLRVNGAVAKLSLGITGIDFPDNYQDDMKKVSINNVYKNVSSDEDAVFFDLEELTHLKGRGLVKPKIGNAEMTAQDTTYPLDIEQLEMAINNNEPLLFIVSTDPQATDYRSVSLDYLKNSPYSRREIWIVSKDSIENGAVQTIPLIGFDGVWCRKYKLRGINKDKPIKFPESSDTPLFLYQLCHTSVIYDGFETTIHEARHDWSIFSGNSARLLADDSDEWANRQQEQCQNVRINQNVCELLGSNSIYYVIIHGKKRPYRILHIPPCYLIKIREGVKFDCGEWVYLPEEKDKIQHLDIIEHINRKRRGTLINTSNKKSLLLYIDCPDLSTMAWLDNDGGYEQYSEDYCRLPQTFQSYSDLNGRYLCFAPVLRNQQLTLVRSDGSSEYIDITPDKNGMFREELSRIIKSNGIIDANSYDKLLFNNDELVKIRCYPTNPVILRQNGIWKAYIPENQVQRYKLLFFSEKCLETFTDFCCVDCNTLQWLDQLASIIVPDRLTNGFAVYACFVPARKQINTFFDFWKEKYPLEKVKESTAEGNQFDNPVTLKCILEETLLGANFEDAKMYIYTAQINREKLAAFWKDVAGKIMPNDIEEDIGYCLNFMFQNGFNFIAEPAIDDDGRKDYGRTWLTTAWKELCNNVRRRISVDSYKKSSFPEGERFIEQKMKLVKAVIDNNDRPRDNLICGFGWLPICLACDLLYSKKWVDTKVYSPITPNSNKLKITFLFESSGIRELTFIANFAAIWDFKFIDYDNAVRSFDRKFLYKNLEKGIPISILIPEREGFLQKQEQLFNRDLAFLPEVELFIRDEFDRVFELTLEIIDRLLKQRNNPSRIIGKHLLTIFQYICENVKELYYSGKEDIERATMGLVAIICRVMAHCNTIINISEDEYGFILSIVKRVFADKYNHRNERDTLEANGANARWRFLMRCLCAVEVVIAFYNISYPVSTRTQERRGY